LYILGIYGRFSELPVEFRVKLTKIGNSLRITIPKPVVDGLRLRERDMLILTVTDSEIKIRKGKRK
jgi:AbrB family looped-hinge helix DNA binding protein